MSVSRTDSRGKLVRENTFTKDDSSVSQSSAVVASASKFQSAAATSSYQSQDNVRLVRGKLVKVSAQTDEDRTYGVSDLRASVARPSDNLALEGKVDYSKKGSEWVAPTGLAFRGRQGYVSNESHIELVDATAALQQNREARAAIKTRSKSQTSSTRQEKTASLVESSQVSKTVSSKAVAASGKQRAVRRRTWTKEDNENLSLEDLEVAQYVGNLGASNVEQESTYVSSPTPTYR